MSEPRGSLGNYVDRLLAAVDRGEVEIRFNLIALNTPGRATYSALENNIVVLLPLVAAATAFYWYGWMWAAVCFVVGLVLLLSVWRRWVFSRAQARAWHMLRRDQTAILDFWRDAMLMLHHVPSGTDCVPPNDDWRAFVREHLLNGR